MNFYFRIKCCVSVNTDISLPVYQCYFQHISYRLWLTWYRTIPYFMFYQTFFLDQLLSSQHM